MKSRTKQFIISLPGHQEHALEGNMHPGETIALPIHVNTISIMDCMMVPS